MAGSHRLFFRFAFFAFEAVEQGSEVFDFAAQGQDAHFFMAQRLFQISELAQNVAQFALHRKRAFGALLASGDGHVVEAFTGLREEERIGIFQRQLAGKGGIGNDVAVAQLGQDDFERSPKPVEHANRIFQRTIGRSGCTWCAFSSTAKENLACESSGCTRKVARPSTSVRSRRKPSSAASQDFTTM